MSQKVHAKSIRDRLWGYQGNAWYSEDFYSHNLVNSYCYGSLMYKLYIKNLCVKVIKAPNKRRLRKSVYSFSTVPTRILGNLFVLSPLLGVFPRKGLTAKYNPLRVQKGKRRSFFVVPKVNKISLQK